MRYAHGRLSARSARLAIGWWLTAVAVVGGIGGWWLAGKRSSPEGGTVGARTAAVTPSALPPALREATIAFTGNPGQKGPKEGFLPSSCTAVYGSCVVDRAVSPEKAVCTWSWNGGEAVKVPLSVGQATDKGREVSMTLRSADGKAPLGAGVGEVEVHLEGRRVARGSFVAAEAASEVLAQAVPTAAQTTVTDVKCAHGVGPEGEALAESRTFVGDEKVWVLFKYANATRGTAFVVRWAPAAGDVAPLETAVTAEGESGIGSAWLGAAKGKELPLGGYKASISYGTGGAPLAEATFEVVAEHSSVNAQKAVAGGESRGARPPGDGAVPGKGATKGE